MRPAAFVRGKLAETGADRRTLSPAAVVRGYLAIEALLLTAIGIGTVYACAPGVSLFQAPAYPAAIMMAVAFAGIAFGNLGLYRLAALSANLRQLPSLALGWTVACAAFGAAILAFNIGADIARLWLLTWFTAGGLGLISLRLAIAWIVRRAAISGRVFVRAAIYGTGPLTDDFLEALENDTAAMIRVAGVFDDRRTPRTLRRIAGYPRIGGLDDIIALNRSRPLDLLIVSLPVSAESRIENVARHLSGISADVKIPAEATSLRLSPHAYSDVGSASMIDIFDNPGADWNSLSKWLLDKSFATAALVALAPLLMLIALALKLESRGPVFARRTRYDFHNQPIGILEFRSTHSGRPGNAARSTRIGDWIHAAGLDALPRLINVLKGDLSLVGPSPHASRRKAGPDRNDVDGYCARHNIKPGVTGWAQINGWPDEDEAAGDAAEKRIALDRYYIEHRSVLFDLYILFRTPFALLSPQTSS